MHARKPPPMSIEQGPQQRTAPQTRPEVWGDDMKLIGETVIPDPQHRDKKPEDKNFLQRNKKKIGLALAGIGLAATGGFVAKTTMGGEAAPAPEREPSVSAPVNPGEVEATMPEFGLNPEAYVNNPEQIAYDFFDQYNTWQNTEITQDVMDNKARYADYEKYGYDLPLLGYAALEVNAESDSAFIDTLITPEWGADADLYDWIETAKRIHAVNTYKAIITADDGASQESYKRFLDIENVEVISATENEIVVIAAHSGRDNRELNESESVSGADSINPNDETGTYSLTFTKDSSGSMKLTNLDYL
jgi:hypothetical protein